MSYGEGSAEYQRAITDLNDAYRNGMRAFAKWCVENWKIVDSDRKDWCAERSDDWVAGYNAGMEAIDAALDCFLEELHP